MNKCKTCKYWEKHHVYDRGTCEQPEEDDLSKNPAGLHVSVCVSDDSGLWVTLRTGPEFGCVNWKAKK